MKMYSLYLSEPVLNIINELSRKSDTTTSELIREAMRDFIEKCVARNLMTREEVDKFYPREESQ